MRIIYTGCSWAHRSFDTRTGEEEKFTNLAHELKLNVIDLSQNGSSNRTAIQRVKKYLLRHPIQNNETIKIILVYCEPLLDGWSYFNYNNQDKFLRDLVHDNHWKDTRDEINDKNLKEISDLHLDIGLIGGHSDIYNNNNDLKIIHPSWQHALAEEQCHNFIGWGCEVMHRVIVEQPNINPNKSLVNEIIKTFSAWRQLETHNVFNFVHPNTKGNVYFANQISNNIHTWIDN